MFITIPAMVGLIVLREPIVRLLFQRGAFGQTTTLMTARALLYYSVGLWAFAGLRVFVSAFYSLQDTKTPVKVAVVAMLTNILLSIILMRTPLEHGGLALALSLASTFQLIMLIVLLRRRLGGIEGRVVATSMVRSFVASLFMGACIHLLAIKVLGGVLVHGVVPMAFGICVIIGAGMALYLILARFLGSQELSYLIDLLRGRTTPEPG
jgi:putative peptidoglycan lipid II flippase